MPTNTISETIHKLKELKTTLNDASRMARDQGFLKVAFLQDEMCEALDDAILYLTDLDICQSSDCQKHF